MNTKKEKEIIVGVTVPKNGTAPLYFGMECESGSHVFIEYKSLDQLVEVAEAYGYKVVNN